VFTNVSVTILRILGLTLIGLSVIPFTMAQDPEKKDEKDEAVKVNTALVTLPVIVSDRSNRYISGLTQSDFRIFQDGSEQKIAVFSDQEAPMSVILALDTSVSTKPVIGSIKNAAKEFIRKLGPADLCMVLTFDFKIRVLSPLTADKKALDSSIKKAQAGKTGGTVLNDALYLGINDILKNINGRKAVVVLTDGKDYKSDHRTNDVLDRISGADTVIYPIYFETEDRPASRNPRLFGLGRFSINGRQSNPDLEPTNAAARIFLQQIADLTGGRLFSPAGQKLNDAFNQIADEMKRQYLVGYYPPEDVKTGAIHKLRVQVDRPNTVVRSKAEYRNQSK